MKMVMRKDPVTGKVHYIGKDINAGVFYMHPVVGATAKTPADVPPPAPLLVLAADDGKEDENAKRKSRGWMNRVSSHGPLDLPKIKMNGPVDSKKTKTPLGKCLRNVINEWWQKKKASALACHDGSVN